MTNKMAVSSVVILMALLTGVLQVDGSYFPQFYPLQKTLESALTTEETLYIMRQVFFPVVRISAQETQQVQISVCVEIIVDHTLITNSTSNDSCTVNGFNFINANESESCKNKSCWDFLWTDSALLSLITIDQLAAFDALSVVIYNAAIGKPYHSRNIDAFLPLICPVMPDLPDIKTSLMLLLSWSKSYARHHGVPPQWEETDKGYIQELYDDNYLAESTYNENDVHLIRLGMITSFTLLNILVLIGVLMYGKQFYMKVYHITSGSNRLAAVTWAFMLTASLINSLYLLMTFFGFATFSYPHPRIWECLISKGNCSESLKSSKLYSDEVASLMVKLTIVPFAIVVELIIAVRLTGCTLLTFPCTMANSSQYCFFRYGKTAIQTILIWNVMIFIQLTFGVVLLPVGILTVIAPVTTISLISTMFLILIEFIGFFVFFILRWCNPISFRRCCSIALYAHIFTTIVILLLSAIALTLYFSLIGLGVQPWSVKGSILSLLPSILVTPLLWFAKRYFFKKERATEEVKENGISMTVHNHSTTLAENTEREEDDEDEEEDANEEMSLISVV